MRIKHLSENRRGVFNKLHGLLPSRLFLTYTVFAPDPFWYRVATLANYVDVLTAALAAIPGILELSRGIPRHTRAKKRGMVHGGLNSLALILFAINAYRVSGMEDAPPAQDWTALILTGMGFLITLAAGYHGWKLVAHHKVGVELSPEQERIQNEIEKIPGKPLKGEFQKNHATRGAA